jgi:hypothetical protein
LGYVILINGDAVKNLKESDHPLVPEELVVLTRQKYAVSFSTEFNVNEGDVRPELSIIKLLKAVSEATCRL